MRTVRSEQVNINGFDVLVEYKEIKNIHLSVLPPNGKVRISAPLDTSAEMVRLAIITRSDWIKKQRDELQGQARDEQKEYVSGESHYLFGNRYRLDVVEKQDRSERTGVTLKNKSTMEMTTSSASTRQSRESMMREFYREQLMQEAERLIPAWGAKLGIPSQEIAFTVRRMKARWGSFHQSTNTMILNLELARKPIQCIEYIVVHELTHYWERTHDDRFVQILSKHLPQWQERRALLNDLPYSHIDWEY